MSPFWQRTVISGGLAIGVAIVALLGVIAYALLSDEDTAPAAVPSPIATAGISEGAAGIMEELSLEGLTSQADLIVVGTVTHFNSYWNPEHTHIFTDVSLSVETTVKGVVGTEEVVVRLAGGQVEGITQWASDSPSLALGERVLLFLRSQEGGTFSVVGGFQGEYAVEGEEVAGQGKPLAQLISEIEKIMRGASETEGPQERQLP